MKNRKDDASNPITPGMSRKQFIRGALWAAGAVMVLPGCGSDDDGGGSGGSSGSGGNGGSGGSNGGSGGSGNGGSGGTSGGAGGSGGTGMTGCGATIMSNHGHMLVVSQDDVDAGVDKTYDIQGGSAHTHEVTVTAADFATLAGGGNVTLTTTTAVSHMHTISVTCA